MTAQVHEILILDGEKRVPRGEQIQYVHMGFGSVYEEKLHIAIEEGVVVGTRTIENRVKEYDPHELALQNLPGDESRFPGDGKV